MERIEFYTDYRTYLKDYYTEQKKHHSYFSYRYFCNKAGIASPALYKEVVGGQRNLTERTTQAFIKGMGLIESDASFFRVLVHFNQSENEKEKVELLNRLRGLKRRVKQDVVPLDLYEYYSVWYYPVLRELACILNWEGDYRLLSRTVIPAIKKTEARNGIEFLLRKGFLKIDENGRYVQTNPAITTGSEVSSLAIRAFNEIMAGKGAEAIRNVPPTERDVRTVIAGISRRSYAVMKEEIREFVARIVRLVDDDKKSDRVYSLNVQLFPLTQFNDKGELPHEDA